MELVKLDKYSSLSHHEQRKHPEWIGKWRELSQLIQETQEEGVQCFI